MFTAQNLQLNRGSSTANAQGKYTTTFHTFKDTESTIANIIAYFPPFLGQNPTQENILVGDHIYILGSDTTSCNEILSLDPFTVGSNLFAAPSVGLSVGAPITGVDQNGAVISSETFTLEKADGTHPGIVTTADQTFAGIKTFANGIVAPGTNYTVSTPITAIDNNTLVINNTTKVVQSEIADATHAGIVSSSAQTFGGVKTFADGIVAPGTTYTIGAPAVASDNNGLVINNTTSTLQTQLADATHAGIVSATTQSFGGAKTFIAPTTVLAGTDVTAPTLPLSGLIIRGDDANIGSVTIGGSTVQLMSHLFGSLDLGIVGGVGFDNTDDTGQRLYFSLDTTTFPDGAGMSLYSDGTAEMLGNRLQAYGFTYSADGIEFPSSDQIGTFLDFSDTAVFQGAFSSPTKSVPYTLQGINHTFTLMVADLTPVAVTDPGQPIFTGSSSFPSRARPTVTNKSALITVTNNGVVGIGQVLIDGGGNIHIYSDLINSGFTGVSGFPSFSITWTTTS